MQGKFVSLDGRSVKLRDSNGTEGDHEVAVGATVTLNGKPADLSDFRLEDNIVLAGGDPATSVVGIR